MAKDELSAEADAFLGEALIEFKEKQKVLDDEWGFNAFCQWAFELETGVLKLQFRDGKTLIADGQLLGTQCVSDGTFEWAWNNPKFKDRIIRDSKIVKQVGKRLNLRYTQFGMIPVPGEVYVSYICAIGLKASQALGVFRGSEGDVLPVVLVRSPRWI